MDIKEEFDPIIVKRIEDATKNIPSRYLNYVYGKRTLVEDLKKRDDLDELRAKIEKLENNHIQHLGEDIYKLGVEMRDLKTLLKGAGLI